MNGMYLGERSLIQKVRTIAKEIWDVDCTLPIEISGRMTRALGTYYYRQNRLSKEVNPSCLKFSKHLLNGNYSETTIDSVIKHELAHWQVSLRTPYFHDGDGEFENELKRIGAHSTNVIVGAGDMYTCTCSKCGKDVVKKRTAKQAMKYAQPKYSSKCCRAPLKYVGQKHFEDTTTAIIPKEEKLKKVSTITRITQINVQELLGNVPKVSNQQMIPAIRAAVEEGSKEKIEALKNEYPTIFQSSLKYLPKKIQAKI